MNNEIKDSLYSLYDLYWQHKALYNFWKNHQNIKGEEEIKERIEYLKKNPNIKQRTELETLFWVLGEVE